MILYAIAPPLASRFLSDWEGGCGREWSRLVTCHTHGWNFAMSFIGTVENGVVVLPPQVHLPDGTKVRVEPEQPVEEGAPGG